MSRLLIVEDHPILADALRTQVHQLLPQSECLMAGTLAEALHLHQQFPSIALVVLDLNLPDSQDMATLDAICEVRKTGPLMVFSSSQNVSLLQHCAFNRVQLAASNAVECMRHLQDWYELQLAGKSQNATSQAVSADAVLRPLVAECLAMAHSHCINLRYCRNNSVVMTNPVAVQRILRNLIHNALTYTPAGGKVLIGCRRKKDRLWIYCIDNGQGMTDQQLSLCSRAHQRFSHTENSINKHQGLGLYSVSEMSEQLGLQLQIKSKHGKGSVFAVGVPLALQPLSSDVLMLGHVI